MIRDKGAQYEREALRYLKSQGLSLLAKNFRSRYGEIDLIMRHENCLAFVEVRYRKRNRFSTACGSVDARKQKKIVKTAAAYLSEHPFYANETVRFDVVAFDATENTQGRIQWIQDAFRA